MPKYTSLAGKGNRSRATRTPQNKPIPGSENMVKNHAGGYSFDVGPWTSLKRFLILGVEGNTYYQTQGKLVKEHANNTMELIKENPHEVVDLVVDISEADRAFSREPALFVLALVASLDAISEQNIKARQYALNAFHKVARTSTDLFTFVDYVNDMRGWSRGLRNAVANWYHNLDDNRLSLQAWKYKSRNGWSHRDVMRLAHPKTDDSVRRSIYEYMAKPDEAAILKGEGASNHPSVQQILAAEELLHLDKGDVKRAVKLIQDWRLTHEAVPSDLKNEAQVWEALLENMPMTAMLRNLNKMTAVGLLDMKSKGTNKVLSKLGSAKEIKESRVHPMRFLIAAKQYEMGQGSKGNLTWKPNASIVDALNDAFYTSFGNVTPTGRSILVAIDTSGSMGGGYFFSNGVAGIAGFSPLEAATALALVFINTEPNVDVIGVDTSVRGTLGLSTRMTLGEAFKKVRRNSGGGTNLELPFSYAEKKRMQVDAFVSLTDSESWAGYRHPIQGLDSYRRTVNSDALGINIAMVANRLSALDPNTKGVLEVAGFDGSTTQIISEFVSGNL